MDYRILGPLEVRDGTEPLELTGARQRTLLAVLLLHRNEVVSADRLIDAVWGEHPPSSAPKALQNAVLQVRRALGGGAGALRTRPGGYVLEVAPGELDADRFERLAAAGREALAAGDVATASERLREALAVWRGRPLADLEYDGFAAADVRRLDEERLTTSEDRIEADLALGRHAELVPELEEAVARHPLRERLRIQLMRALYAAGRQADALAVFHDARRTLLDELGIEPGPALRECHEAILRQDPALAAPRARRARPEPAVPVRLIGAAGAVLVLAAAAAAVLLAASGGEPRRAARITGVPGNSLVAIDPASARVVAAYPAGSTPTSVASGAGGTWTLNADDGTLTRVSARTSVPRTFSLPETPLDVAASADAVWAIGGTQTNPYDPKLPSRLFEVDPDTGSVRRDVALPAGDSVEWFALDRLAVSRNVVWALGADDRLLRVDSDSGVAAVVRGVRASSVAADDADAWAITQSPQSYVLARVSPGGRVTARVPVAATELDGLAVGAGAVWVTSPQDGLLWRVTPDGTRTIDVGAGARGVAVAGGAIWVANAARGTVTRVAADGDVTDVVRLGNAPRGVAYDGELLWVSVAAAGGAPARDSARAAVGAVTAPACGDVISGAARPERLIVSDLPLHQSGISALPDAIAFVLRRREFRAGEFSLGYQSCDDSTAKQGNFEPEKCRANAALYARTPRVIGIVGPYNSDCAREQLGITNRAPGGPLATISPTNTGLDLTKPVPGADPSALEALYPTGRRHYARLWGADDAQGAALARFAQARGIERLAIVREDDDYSQGNSFFAAREARRLGIRVLGPYPLNVARGPGPARRLAARIAADRPDALLHTGVPFFGPPGKALPGFELVRRARELAGPELLLLGTDSWASPQEVFAEVGDVGAEIHVAYPGLPLERLPAAGRRFAAEFAATRPGGIVTVEAVYTAQATEILLDAIARSDGSRGSVADALLATDLEDTLVGDVAFDADGDTRPRPFTIVRLQRGPAQPGGVLPGGSNIAAVIRP